MGQYQVPAVAYPPPPQSYPAATEDMKNSSSGYVVSAPPPIGYPVRDAPPHYPQQNFPHETQSRGDGFWKGCCAALCCCWILDCVF